MNYQDFKIKVVFWKDKLEHYKNTTTELDEEYIDHINTLIGHMNTAINRMDDATNGDYPNAENNLMNYNQNFDVVEAFIISLDPRVQTTNEDTTVHDAISYMTTTSMEINPAMNTALDFFTAHPILTAEYDALLEEFTTQIEDYEELLESLKNSSSKPAAPADPLGKNRGGDTDTEDDDSGDEGVYYAENITDYSAIFYKDPLAKTQDDIVIPGLESIIDFSFFGSLVTI